MLCWKHQRSWRICVHTWDLLDLFQILMAGCKKSTSRVVASKKPEAFHQQLKMKTSIVVIYHHCNYRGSSNWQVGMRITMIFNHSVSMADAGLPNKFATTQDQSEARHLLPRRLRYCRISSNSNIVYYTGEAGYFWPQKVWIQNFDISLTSLRASSIQ